MSKLLQVYELLEDKEDRRLKVGDTIKTNKHGYILTLTDNGLITEEGIIFNDILVAFLDDSYTFEILPKKEKKFIPEVGVRYCFINEFGRIEKYTNHNDDYDKYVFKHRPIFENEEQCKRYAEFQKDLDSLSYKFSNEEWENEDIPKYFISLDMRYNQILFDCTYTYKEKNIYFKSQTGIQFLIGKYSKEYILHYYFDVWEG